jgi:hypothetical protein
MQEKCKLFKFVLLFAAFIGGVSSAHGEVFRKKNLHGAADRTPCGLSTAKQIVPLVGKEYR